MLQPDGFKGNRICFLLTNNILRLTCAIPEPIRPPPMTVTFLITLTTFVVEKVRLSNNACGRDMFSAQSDDSDWIVYSRFIEIMQSACNTKVNT